MPTSRNKIEIPISSKDSASATLQKIRAGLQGTARDADQLASKMNMGGDSRWLKGLGGLLGGLTSPIAATTTAAVALAAAFKSANEKQIEAKRIAFDETLKQQITAWNANTTAIDNNIAALQRRNKITTAAGGESESLVPQIQEKGQEIARQRQALEKLITDLNSPNINTANRRDDPIGRLFFGGKLPAQEIKRQVDAARAELKKLETEQITTATRVADEQANATIQQEKTARAAFDRQMKTARTASDRFIDNIDREIEQLKKRNEIALDRGDDPESAGDLFLQRGQEIERQLHDAQAYFDQARRALEKSPGDGNAKHIFQSRADELNRLADLQKENSRKIEDELIEDQQNIAKRDKMLTESAKKAADEAEKAHTKAAKAAAKAWEQVANEMSAAATAAEKKLARLVSPTSARREQRDQENADRKAARREQNQIDRARRAVGNRGGTARQREIAELANQRDRNVVGAADAAGRAAQEAANAVSEEELQALKDIREFLKDNLTHR